MKLELGYPKDEYKFFNDLLTAIMDASETFGSSTHLFYVSCNDDYIGAGYTFQPKIGAEPMYWEGITIRLLPNTVSLLRQIIPDIPILQFENCKRIKSFWTSHERNMWMEAYREESIDDPSYYYIDFDVLVWAITKHLNLPWVCMVRQNDQLIFKNLSTEVNITMIKDTTIYQQPIIKSLIWLLSSTDAIKDTTLRQETTRKINRPLIVRPVSMSTQVDNIELSVTTKAQLYCITINDTTFITDLFGMHLLKHQLMH